MCPCATLLGYTRARAHLQELENKQQTHGEFARDAGAGIDLRRPSFANSGWQRLDHSKLEVNCWVGGTRRRCQPAVSLDTLFYKFAAFCWVQAIVVEHSVKRLNRWSHRNLNYQSRARAQSPCQGS